VGIDKYLVVIGLSDEDTAHLRLLMRMGASSKLNQPWRWGTESNADLVVVDPSVFAGQMARNRASSGGRRCAVLSDTETLREGELRLSRPLKLDNIAAVLNEIATAGQVETPAPIIPQKDDFYELELSEDSDAQLEEGEPPLESGEQRERTPALGLEDLIRPDSAATKPAFSVPLQLEEDTTIEKARLHTARKERRVADSIDGRRELKRPAEINLMPEGIELAAATGPVSLRAYLGGHLLGGPSMITLPNTPSLVLDPKQRVYHSSAASLHLLSPYCKQTLPERSWRTLTTGELSHLRGEQPAQKYSRLIWLATLVQSAGRLATHLDPGGRYRLKTGATHERDNPRQARIANAMFDFAKLNEIAAHSGASMAEVFDVVNAYDAINALDLERRISRYNEPASKPAGFFARLFGKR
jgi:hypothetical protein